jgi:predicted nucleic acid-binding protein
MTGAVFVDTNVLVYARDVSESEKQRQAMAWMTHLWESRRGRLSVQVLQEYYVTATQKLSPGMTRDAARHDVRNLMAWRPVTIDAALLERAWTAQDRHRLAFWDGLIVAAAQVAGCRYLLTEDFQPDQQLDDLTVVNPFLREAGSLG